MTADPDRLRRLLADLEEHLRRQQAPIVDAWRPGLAPGGASATVETELGWLLPVEVEVWFEWHDGVNQQGPAFGGDEFRITGRDLLMLSLKRSVALYRDMRRSAERMEQEDGVFTADEWWPPRWLPLLATRSADLIAVDCDVPAGDASPVHYHYSHDVPGESREPRTPSVAAAASMWVDVLERGLSYYDPEQGRWQRRRDGFDEDLRRAGLV